jgi:Ca2+-binding EF-hand superfamily protein
MQDNSGHISIKELKSLFGNSEQITEELWAILLHNMDRNSDGKVM